MIAQRCDRVEGAPQGSEASLPPGFPGSANGGSVQGVHVLPACSMTEQSSEPMSASSKVRKGWDAERRSAAAFVHHFEAIVVEAKENVRSVLLDPHMVVEIAAAAAFAAKAPAHLVKGDAELTFFAVDG
jgi:hypothetical protein